MTPQPEELADKLLSELSRIASEGLNNNKAVLNKLKEDATELQKTNAGLAFVVFAGVAFFEHDTENMLKFHRNAFRNSPHNLHVNANYAVSLGNTGRYLEALTYARKALVIAGDTDIEYLKDIVKYCLRAGFLTEANFYSSRLETMKVESDNLNVILTSIKLINDLGLSEVQIQAYYSTLTEVLTNNDTYRDGDYYWIMEDDDETTIVREILVDTTVQHAVKMNDELANLVVNKGLSTDLLMAFSCSFTAVKHDEY